MGKFLEKEGLTPDAVLSSPTRCAFYTTAIVIKYCHYKGYPSLIRSFYADGLGVYKALRFAG
jgi:phosphohistidine phosphatase SixA